MPPKKTGALLITGRLLLGSSALTPDGDN